MDISVYRVASLLKIKVVLFKFVIVIRAKILILVGKEGEGSAAEEVTGQFIQQGFIKIYFRFMELI